ncbi:glycosyltransferase family 2 protein [Geomonas sp.]|uniref:glycosyltransferase family 2 protein n=1 Tax=Geomonas sp. TaxID=2651584 RepID=UPI002B481E05|nr:glycosyltransferase [Geomonas sp.]HJV36719.1 glycosyltransferase [Geomonas sp.]
MQPTVSIIVPVYNCEKYVAQAIDSVLGQGYPAVECIVVDDGSTDGTAEVARSYGARVRYLRQDNQERSAARNNGIAQATGSYIGFLDADDLLLPGKLAEQVAFLEGHPEYDVVYSRVSYFREESGRDGYTVRRPTPSGDILPLLIYTNFITMNSPLFRRDAVARVQGFDTAYCRYEDWDFLLRLALTGSRFGFLDSCNAACRMHGENTVKDLLRMFEAKLAVARKVVGLYEAQLAECGIDGRDVAAFHSADYGRKLILAGRVEEGRRLIDEACRRGFPHARKFRLFSLAAGVAGHRLLGAVQRYADYLVKYRKASSGK